MKEEKNLVFTCKSPVNTRFITEMASKTCSKYHCHVNIMVIGRNVTGTERMHIKHANR